ncbi:hypothetical protein H1C71_032662, partial [Ictidomys tridecemlineatus]
VNVPRGPWSESVRGAGGLSSPRSPALSPVGLNWAAKAPVLSRPTAESLFILLHAHFLPSLGNDSEHFRAPSFRNVLAVSPFREGAGCGAERGLSFLSQVPLKPTSASCCLFTLAVRTPWDIHRPREGPATPLGRMVSLVIKFSSLSTFPTSLLKTRTRNPHEPAAGASILLCILSP